MDNLFSLEGKSAIVTGGNGGIGKGIADGLARAGADIAIAARNEAKITIAAKDIRERFGVRVLEIKTDVRQEEEIRTMVQKVWDHFGRIDILVNNAGTSFRKNPQDFTAADWDETLNINLRSAFFCAKYVYPAMKAQGGGKIICIGSMTSLFGGAQLPLYGASKGGIVQLARSLAVAWAPDNIQVNSILPGYIDTDLIAKAERENPGLKKYVISRTPMRRLAAPEELGGTAAYLASRASDFVTGAAIPVDGGYSVML
jgi:2-dehydro-3-deoxy-D-gluconate 5-dehydrogenase